MRVVIDTNVLVAAIAPASPYHVIFKHLMLGKYTLLLSTDIYFEYTEILALKSKPINLCFFEKFIVESEHVLVEEPSTRWNSILADKDDNNLWIVPWPATPSILLPTMPTSRFSTHLILH